ncbi:MAG: hypothetical protein ABSA93_38585 [Streptosporangiaceae bacterium]
MGVSRALKHRLVAVAPDPGAAVRFAGAWLFDQVMAGWDVTVLTPAGADSRPLRILGASVADLTAAPAGGSAPELLAVCTQLSVHTERICRIIREAQSTADVWLWGEREAEMETLGVMRHQPSAAARAFKAHALAAAGIPAQPCGDEIFRRFCGVLPGDQDLRAAVGRGRGRRGRAGRRRADLHAAPRRPRRPGDQGRVSRGR